MAKRKPPKPPNRPANKLLVYLDSGVVVGHNLNRHFRVDEIDTTRIQTFGERRPLSRAVTTFDTEIPDPATIATLERPKALLRRRRMIGILDAWSTVLPIDIVNEQIGDYIEDVNRRIDGGQRFFVYIRIASGVFWTLMNAIGYFMQNALGRRKAG